MHQIIYTSQAAGPLSDAGLCALLQEAQRANAARHVTGALVYGRGQFIQVLEGERATVAALYARIAQDPRHTNLFKLTDEAIAQRRFGEWAMGFRAVSAAALAELAGYQSPAQMRASLPTLTTPEAILVNLMRSLLLDEPASAPVAG